MHTRLLRELIETPVKDKRRHEQVHFAVIVKRGKILARGQNYDIFNNRLATVHAEKAVLLNLGDLSKLKGAEIFIWRNTNENFGLESKPCNSCVALLSACCRKWGLARITWTTDATNEHRKERLKYA